MPDGSQLYPILFEPIYKEKVWGGRRFERLGRALPGEPGTLVGESWEVADLASTSPTGGGGGSARSRVAHGPLAGRALHELIRDHGPALLGEVSLTEEGGFPLLVKYLDAHQNLSIQVHPPREYAARHAGAHVKSEAWYVVHSQPGAVIYKGVVAGTGPDDFARAVRANRVAELMIEVPALAGDCHYLPSGTCHALGSGVLVAEVQTPSDTTFRIYDWGRTDRELHIERALECIDFGPVDAEAFEPGMLTELEGATVRSLVHCPHFAIGEWKAEPGYRGEVDVGRPEIWMVVGGRAEIRSPTGRYDPVLASTGQTLLLPASLALTVLDVIDPLVMLRITFPAG